MILCGGFLFGALSGCGGPSRVPASDSAEPRGLWITRWDFRSAEDVDRCIDDAARHRFTDVYFQVRGQADAFYRSALEPWGQELLLVPPLETGASVADSSAAPAELVYRDDPGYDPLERAIRRARRHRLRLHAWVNVYPLWRGLEPPLTPDHPWHRNPDWLLHDDRGEPQRLNDHYVVANPVNPAVQAHLVDVVRDLCARYDLDGLHLDYVRFVTDRLDSGRLWPGDAQSLALWRMATAAASDPLTPDGRAVYRDWLRDEITGLVERVAAEARRTNPRLEITAAVIRRPERARDEFLQDAVVWLERGLVDRLLPMIYTRDAAVFEADLAAWRSAAPAERLSPGIGVYLQDPCELAPQLTASLGTAGWTLFAYSALFESVNPDQDRSPEAGARRRQLRALLMP